MDKWIQDLIKELEGLEENEIKQRMRQLKYGPPTSPRYEVVENYLNHLPKPITDISKTKRWYEKPSGIFFLGVTASLLAAVIFYFFGFS